jgi:hypothetical protein
MGSWSSVVGAELGSDRLPPPPPTPQTDRKGHNNTQYLLHSFIHTPNPHFPPTHNIIIAAPIDPSIHHRFCVSH